MTLYTHRINRDDVHYLFWTRLTPADQSVIRRVRNGSQPSPHTRAARRLVTYGTFRIEDGQLVFTLAGTQLIDALCEMGVFHRANTHG